MKSCWGLGLAHSRRLISAQQATFGKPPPISSLCCVPWIRTPSVLRWHRFPRPGWVKPSTIACAVPQRQGHDMTETLERLKQAAGPNGFSESVEEISPYLEEWRGRLRGQSALLLKPATTEQVSAILAICHQTGT